MSIFSVNFDFRRYLRQKSYAYKMLTMNPQLQAIIQQAIQAFRVENFDEADSILKGLLQNDINNSEAIFELGITYAEANKISEAIIIFNCLHYLNIRDQKISYNLGFLYALRGDFESARQSFDRAIESNPGDLDALVNYGSILHELKRFDEALAYYDKVLCLQSDYEKALYNKGNTLHKLKRYDEAIAHYDKALSLNSDNPEALSNKGLTLHELKRYDEAIAHYDKALSLKADIDWVYGNLVHTQMKICSWSGLVDDSSNISKKVWAKEKVATPFSLLAMNDDALLHKKCSEIFAQDKYTVNSALGPISKRANNKKIRIAYFSPDFRSHPVSFLTSELFEIHNRGSFEVFAFSLQKSPIEDETNLHLRHSFDRFIDVEKMSDSEIAQLARELEVDIAIDLAGLTQYSRTGIFSYRAAPIQVNWLGYAGTIGADFIDYIVADKTIIPESHHQFYTEKVMYLPDTYMVDDSKRIPSSRVFIRKECGLPDNAFVFCCFNNDYKFNPQVLDGWSRILLAVDNSVLWISENNEHFKANIATEFEMRGIDSNRIIFAQRVELMADHLARSSLADLFLDTHPYNAHTTALDSLKTSVPVLTLMGQSFASRVAASLLNAIDLPELITNTQEEYEALAIELAMNPKKLADIKLRLTNNRVTTPLFNTPLFTKNLEAAYIKMMERYQADLKPDHISIL